MQANPESPWLGLRSFAEADRDYFFGRDDEIDELYQCVTHKTLTVLFGKSGMGKTSLLHAGLIPQLRETGYEPVYIRLLYESSKDSQLQQQVLNELANSCGSCEAEQKQPLTLWQMLRDPKIGLAGNDSAKVPVFIFDQFEEIFNENVRPDEAAEFMQDLACLVENRPPDKVRQALESDKVFASRIQRHPHPFKVMLSLRDDYLYLLERYRRQMPSLMDNRFELLSLSGPQALLAVYDAGNKRESAPIVSKQTSEKIVRFVAKRDEETPLEEIDNVPPILSLVCDQLNSHRKAEGKKEIEGDDLKSVASNELRKFYDKVLGKFSRRERLAVQRLVEDHLVSKGGNRESLTKDSGEEVLHLPDSDSIIEQLVDVRLLASEARGGVPRIELTHDRLLEPIVESRNERQQRQQRQKARKLIYGACVCVGIVAFAFYWYQWKQIFDQQQKIADREELHALAGELLNLVTNRDPNAYSRVELIDHAVRFLDATEKTYGSNDEHASFPLNAIGNLLWREKKFKEAEYVYARAAAVDHLQLKQGLHDHEFDLATTLSNLAWALREQNRQEEGIPLLRQALSIRERTDDERNVAITSELENLAWFLDVDHPQHDAAILLYRHSLKKWEDVAGSNDKQTAFVLNNLALALFHADEHEKAEPLSFRALCIRNQVLPHTSEDLGTSCYDFARIIWLSGNRVESEALLRYALWTYEESLSPEHEWVAAALNNLVELILLNSVEGDEEKQKEAERYMKQAVEIIYTWNRQTGFKHRYTEQYLQTYKKLLTKIGYSATEIENKCEVMEMFPHSILRITPHIKPAISLDDIIESLRDKYKSKKKQNIYFLPLDQKITPHLEQFLGKLDEKTSITSQLDILLDGPADTIDDILKNLDSKYRQREMPWILDLDQPASSHLNQLLN